MSKLVNDPAAVKASMQPMLDHNLAAWSGLPKTNVETLVAAFGSPAEHEQAALGWYPADRYAFNVESRGGGLTAYVRNGEVVLIETLVAPPALAMQGLGEPTAILPHEILAPDAYVHEYLYA